MAVVKGKSMNYFRRYILLFLSAAVVVLLPSAVLLPDGLSVLKGTVSLILEASLVVLFLLLWKKSIWKERRVFLALFALVSFGIHAWIVFHEPAFLRHYKTQMFLLLSQVPLALVLCSYAGVEPFGIALKDLYLRERKHLDRLSIFSIVLFTGLVFLWSPLNLHISDTESMPFLFTTLLFQHSLYALSAFALFFSFYRFSAERLKPILTVIFTALALISWVYVYLFPGSYGVLDVTVFTEPGSLSVFSKGLNPEFIRTAFLEAAGLLAVLVLAGFGVFRFSGKLLPVIIILNLMISGQTIFNITATQGLSEAGRSSNGSAFLPEDAGHTFRFSRNGNVVVFMLDMFGADLIPGIMEEYPDIKDSLNGFVWYSSTLSTGITTYGSLPSILAGESYTPSEVNKRDDRLMSDMLKDAYAYYPGVSRERGYDFTFVNPVYFPLADYEEAWKVSAVDSRNYMEYWLNSSEEAADLDITMTPGKYARLFSVMGLFKSSPHFLRPFIYLGGRWLMLNRGTLDVNHAVIHLGFLDLLDSLSTVDSGPPTFKFIDNELTHLPWAIGTDLKLKQSSSDDYMIEPEYGVRVVRDNAVFYSAVRALKEIALFVKWMDREGVLDKTKIVIVSDHGYYGLHRQWSDFPVLMDDSGNVVEGSSRVNSLLLVKGFGSRDPFRIDERLMSVADVPAIALSLPDDPAEGEPAEREVMVSFTPSHPNAHGPYHYTVTHQFAVSGDPSLPGNWRCIQQ